MPIRKKVDPIIDSFDQTSGNGFSSISLKEINTIYCIYKFNHHREILTFVSLV